MKTLNQEFSQAIMGKNIAWLVAMLLMISSFPLLKKAVAFILLKLYEVFIQQGIE
jgi:hypothetical protein